MMVAKLGVPAAAAAVAAGGGDTVVPKQLPPKKKLKSPFTEGSYYRNYASVFGWCPLFWPLPVGVGLPEAKKPEETKGTRGDNGSNQRRS